MQARQATHRKRVRSKSRSQKNDSGSSWCLHIVDACLLGILFLVPLFLGGRHPIGRAVMIALSCMAATAHLANYALTKRPQWSPTAAYALFFMAIALVGFQLVPLPTNWLEQIAPRNTSLLPLWVSEAQHPLQLGAWPTVSLNPGATKIALATLVAYALLFFTISERLRTLSDVDRILRLLAISVILMAGFGLLQYLTSNGKFFWFYETPHTNTFRVTKGSFTNRNHFAHFLTLGAAPLLAWIVSRQHSRRHSSKRVSSSAGRVRLKAIDLYLWAGIVGIVVACLLSLSRGGTIALAVAGGTSLAIYFRRKMVGSVFLYGMSLVAVLVIAALSFHDYDRVATRLDDLTSGSLDKLDESQGRRKIWAANVASIREGGFFGAGAGSHREIYPAYLTESQPVEYTHAENGYLQIVTECGYAGAMLLFLALTIVCFWCYTSLRQAKTTQEVTAATAVTASLAASVFHSVADFVWYVPACLSFTIILAAVAFRLTRLINAQSSKSIPSEVRYARPAWSALTLSTALASVWAFSVILGPAQASSSWTQYLLAAGNDSQATTDAYESTSLEPANRQVLEHETAIYLLERVVQADPNSARAHMRLAKHYLGLFDSLQVSAENSMPINQIRDAAINSHYSSSQQLQGWLKRAFGSNVQILYRAHFHTLRGLRLCPLQGEGYLQLASLCFLSGQQQSAVQDLLTQSERVRPHEARILYQIGQQHMHQGRSAETLSYWRKVINSKGSHQSQIINLLASNTSAGSFLDELRPDWYLLPRIWSTYKAIGRPSDLSQLVGYAEGLAERSSSQYTSEQMASIWRSLARMQQHIQLYDDAAKSLAKAFDQAPSNYRIRREYGRVLLEVDQYELADVHLRWCLRRRPDAAKLREELALVRQGLVASQAKSDSSQLGSHY